MNSKRLISVLVSAAFALPGAAMATNGYFAHGYGTKNKAMAGAGIAMPDEAMAAATNPASGVLIGNRVEVGMELFAPYRGYQNTVGTPFPLGGGASGTADVNSAKTLFEIPSFAFNLMLDQDSAVGFAMYGNGGMNTTYRETSTQGSSGTFGSGATTGVNLMQLFMNLNYSRKLGDHLAVGGAAIIAAQRFDARGFDIFKPFSLYPNNLTARGFSYSYGAGLKLGVQGDISPTWSAAASYQSRINMSKFDEYKGLFAGAGSFDIPPTATIGVAWKPSTTLSVGLDVQKIWFSQVDSVGNRMDNIASCGSNPQNCLGGVNGPGFGWGDVTVYKLGATWKTSPKWTWRAGFSTTKQPIPASSALFNVVAPAVVERHYTFGFTRALSKSSELNFAFMYAPSKSVYGADGAAGFTPTESNVRLFMHQYDAELSWSTRW